MTTGERIEALAREQGMSLHKLAALSGVSYNTLYSAAKRKSNRIDSRTLERVASTLGVPIHALTGIFWEEHSDGSSVAVVSTDTQDGYVQERLSLYGADTVGFELRDESERQALQYLIQNNDTDPAWANRLLTAFRKLSFSYQLLMVHSAEEMVREQELARLINNAESGSSGD